MVIDKQNKLPPIFERYDDYALLCNRVYKKGPFNQKVLGFDSQKMFHRPNGLANLRALKNDKEIVLIFRGTRTGEDWISNFNFVPKRTTVAGGESLIHRGFLNRLFESTRENNESLITSVNSYLSNELGNRELVLCGHSLGGALAVLLAHSFPEEYKGKIKVIFTFGQPAVGLSSFFESYTLHDKTFRMCSGIDLVTFLPGPFYRHVGKSIWFHNDDFYLDVSWYKRIYWTIVHAITSIFDDHSMKKYIRNGRYF